MKCLKNIIVDTSHCLKPCSGLIVRSFSKSKLNGNMEDLPIFIRDYDNYKKRTLYPLRYSGKYCDYTYAMSCFK